MRRTLVEFREDHLTDWAAALTYYGILAFFPALLALVALAGLIGDPRATAAKLLEVVGMIASPAVVDAARDPVKGVTTSGSTALLVAIVGSVTALFSASRYAGGFMRASNVMYEVHEGRPAWKARTVQMLVALLMLNLVVVATVTIVVPRPLAGAIGDLIGLDAAAVTVWTIVRWPVVALLVLLAISVMYYASPNARVSGFRSVLPGAALALIVWTVASAALALYVRNFPSDNETFATLGAIITFLVWLWVTNVAVLLGAQFNTERERQRSLERGDPGVQRGLGLAERDEPTAARRPRTA